MPSTLADGKVLLDAFPFDSNPNLITDVNGYLMGDRSVDAWTMRSAFKQFFSNGVFGTPANAWQISKGAEGLTVTVQPGMAVIEGAMGGIEDRTGQLTVTLDNQAAAGNLCYGIFLRYDDNADVRGLTVYARKGTAGASPEIPKPDTTSANVYELRLGYVTVPNGATDLTNATVTNEKGTSVCPYAAPFEEIDLAQVITDARNQAAEVVEDFTNETDLTLGNLQNEVQENLDLIQSAIDGTTAGHLQQQIDELKESTSLDYFDDEYFEVYDHAGKDEVRLAEDSVGTRELKDAAVDYPNLSVDAVQGIATNEVLPVLADLTRSLYDLHLSQLISSDYDSIEVWEFNADIDIESGTWDSSGKKVYCYPGNQ